MIQIEIICQTLLQFLHKISDIFTSIKKTDTLLCLNVLTVNILNFFVVSSMTRWFLLYSELILIMHDVFTKETQVPMFVIVL
jgi:hypothetical protein